MEVAKKVRFGHYFISTHLENKWSTPVRHWIMSFARIKQIASVVTIGFGNFNAFGEPINKVYMKKFTYLCVDMVLPSFTLA